MRFIPSIVLALSLLFGACATTPKSATAPSDATTAAPAPAKKGLQIRLVTLYVDDQEKALTFYSDVLGFQKKDDFSNEGFRWLSVTDGTTELNLALNNNPAAKAFQQAMYKENQPAIMFYTDDLAREHERIKGKGATFKMPPTDVDMALIAQVDDGCGNLVQITELQR
jgi:predicted enzyme related to lactoylglutathione lyase